MLKGLNSRGKAEHRASYGGGLRAALAARQNQERAHVRSTGGGAAMFVLAIKSVAKTYCVFCFLSASYFSSIGVGQSLGLLAAFFASTAGVSIRRISTILAVFGEADAQARRGVDLLRVNDDDALFIDNGGARNISARIRRRPVWCLRP